MLTVTARISISANSIRNEFFCILFSSLSSVNSPRWKSHEFQRGFYWTSSENSTFAQCRELGGHRGDKGGIRGTDSELLRRTKVRLNNSESVPLSPPLSPLCPPNSRHCAKVEFSEE